MFLAMMPKSQSSKATTVRYMNMRNDSGFVPWGAMGAKDITMVLITIPTAIVEAKAILTLWLLQFWASRAKYPTAPATLPGIVNQI